MSATTIVDKYEVTENSISGINSICYVTWEDFAFYLLLAISDEKDFKDYPAQFGKIRIKTTDALKILESIDYRNWLNSDSSEDPKRRIMADVKLYEITKEALYTVLQLPIN
jgi:hypothetical protein